MFYDSARTSHERTQEEFIRASGPAFNAFWILLERLEIIGIFLIFIIPIALTLLFIFCFVL